MKANKKVIAGVVGGVVLALGVAGAGAYLIISHNSRSGQTTVVSSNEPSGSSSSSLVEGTNKITSGGTYTFTGTISSGKISVDTTEAVTIVLNNVAITSSDGAAIKCQENTNVTVELVGENKITANNDNDGINSEGDLIIAGDGSLTINAADDGIHADGMLTVENGTLNITAHEGLEATHVKIDGGNITIKATDDAINAGAKSDKYSVKIEINGGNITIDMGQGDTDAIDSNGDLIINGGTINITAQSPFDFDGTGQLNGGTVTVNGQTITELTNQFGGGMGGFMPGGGQAEANGQAPTSGQAPSDERPAMQSDGQKQSRTRTTTQ